MNQLWESLAYALLAIAMMAVLFCGLANQPNWTNEPPRVAVEVRR